MGLDLDQTQGTFGIRSGPSGLIWDPFEAHLGTVRASFETCSGSIWDLLKPILGPHLSTSHITSHLKKGDVPHQQVLELNVMGRGLVMI